MARRCVIAAAGAKARGGPGRGGGAGAVGGSADYRLPHTGFSIPAGIPAGAVTAEDADLIAHLAAQGKVRMHLTLTPQKLPDATSYNVIADLKGSEHPEQVVVVSGHWIRGIWAPARSTTAPESRSRWRRRRSCRSCICDPRRTLRVIAWMDEESGGAGSQAYTKDHSPEFPKHVAAIESDSGAAHPLGFDVKMTSQRRAISCGPC